MAVQARFDGSRLLVQQLSGRAGDGTVTGSGSIGLAAAAGFPIDLDLRFDDATLARGDDLGATVTGSLSITNSQADGARISGDLALGEVRYQFVRQGAADVHALSGVRHRGEPVQQANAETQDEGVPSLWRLDLRVHGDNQIFVSGMGLDSEWSADLRVRGTSATPRIVGGLDLIRGDLSVAGRRFELTRGHVDFDGARPPAPRLDIEATADIDDVAMTIDITGSSANPRIAFSSTPALPQDEVVSRILFGTSVTEISAIQALQVAASLNALRGGGGGLNPLGKLRSATGLARVRILGADETTGRGTALAAGLYVSNKIYIEVVTDARGFTATQVEIALSRALSLLSQFSQTAGTSGSIRYRRDY
jgi:translocation and assembly module TamB